MIQTVEIFYSFQCPYSYLALDKLCQLESKYDTKFLWQPFSAKASSKNFQSPLLTPERLSYVKEDVLRLAKMTETPIVFPEDWPENEPDPEKSVRGAIIAADLGLSLEYNVKMFHCWWGEGKDPNDQDFFIELCEDLDIDPNEFSGRINTNDTRERARGTFRRGKKLQVFDTPTVIIGEERFVGIDRIALVEDRLKQIELGK